MGVWGGEGQEGQRPPPPPPRPGRSPWPQSLAAASCPAPPLPLPSPQPQIDDPLDAIAVHMGCGIWGLIAGGAFAAPNMVNTVFGPLPGTTDGQRKYGFIMGGDGSVLAAACVCIVVVAGWTLAIMTPFFMILKKIGLFRVSPEVEAQGLDVSHHGALHSSWGVRACACPAMPCAPARCSARCSARPINPARPLSPPSLPTGGSAYPHEQGKGGGKEDVFGVTADMVDRKIQEAIEKALQKQAAV